MVLVKVVLQQVTPYSEAWCTKIEELAVLSNFYWRILDLWCCVNLCCKLIQLYMYIYIYILFSIMVYYRILNIIPVLYSRTLLFTHPIHNSLYLLTLNSYSIPSPPRLLVLGNHKSEELVDLYVGKSQYIYHILYTPYRFLDKCTSM